MVPLFIYLSGVIAQVVFLLAAHTLGLYLFESHWLFDIFNEFTDVFVVCLITNILAVILVLPTFWIEQLQQTKPIETRREFYSNFALGFFSVVLGLTAPFVACYYVAVVIKKSIIAFRKLK